MPRLVVANVPPANRIDVVLQGSAAFTDGVRVSMRRVVHTGSAYQVSATSNTFTLLEGAVNITITTTAGNYSSASFAAMLQAALNAGAGVVNTYAVAINADTGILTVTLTAGVANFSFQLATFARMAAIMGFAATSPAATAVTISGIYPVRLSPSYYLLVSPSLNSGRTGPSLTGQQAIALLAFEGGRYASQVLDETETAYAISSSSFEAWLVDEFGEGPVNLNNGLLAIDLELDMPGFV